MLLFVLDKQTKTKGNIYGRIHRLTVKLCACFVKVTCTSITKNDHVFKMCVFVIFIVSGIVPQSKFVMLPRLM